MNKKNKRRLVIALVVVVLALVGLRILAPFIITALVNDRLAELPVFRGTVDDTDLSILGTSVALNDIRLVKRNGALDAPFLTVETVSVDIDFSRLLGGELHADLGIATPVVNLVRGKDEAHSQDIEDTTAYVEALTAGEAVIAFDSVSVRNGSLLFEDRTTQPEIDARLTGLSAEVDRLNQAGTEETPMPTSFRLEGTVQEKGRLRVQGKADAKAEKATFDADLNLQNFHLVSLNDVLEAYAGMDFEKGILSVAIEAKVNAGRINGQAGVVVSNAELVEDFSKLLEKEGFWEAAKEQFADAVISVFSDDENERAATRTPIEGTLKNPEAAPWTILWQLLHNVVYERLSPEPKSGLRISDIVVGHLRLDVLATPEVVATASMSNHCRGARVAGR